MRNRIFPLLLSTFAAAVLLLTSTAHASDLNLPIEQFQLVGRGHRQR